MNYTNYSVGAYQTGTSGTVVVASDGTSDGYIVYTTRDEPGPQPSTAIEGWTIDTGNEFIVPVPRVGLSSLIPGGN